MGIGYLTRIILFECSDLLAEDNDPTGTRCDPYVVFTVGDKTLKSTSKKSTVNPKWSPREKFEFIVPEWESEFIAVHIYDRGRKGQDEVIGSAVIPLALFAGSRYNDRYRFPLVLPEESTFAGVRSDIHLQITLTTADGRRVEYYY